MEIVTAVYGFRELNATCPRSSSQAGKAATRLYQPELENRDNTRKYENILFVCLFYSTSACAPLEIKLFSFFFLPKQSNLLPNNGATWLGKKKKEKEIPNFFARPSLPQKVCNFIF